MMPTTPGPLATAFGPATVWDGRREARLRPEHAHNYPRLRAGTWESAATLADRVLADRVLAGLLLRGGVESGLRGRLLHPEHFEFRGGGARGPASDGGGGRPRREDR